MNPINQFLSLPDKNTTPMNQLQSWELLLRKSLFSLGIAALSVVTFTSASSAQQSPLSANEQLDDQPTVTSILAEPIDGMPITLQGRVLQLGDDEEEYIFTDGTDEIGIEIHDQAFSFNPDTVIEITGEVCLEAEDSTQHEAHPEEVEIEVYQVRIVTP